MLTLSRKEQSQVNNEQAGSEQGSHIKALSNPNRFDLCSVPARPLEGLIISLTTLVVLILIKE